jgi:hypothetical protein
LHPPLGLGNVPRFVAIRLFRLWGDERELDGEDTAAAGLAFQRHLSTQHTGELARDRQTETGSPALAVRLIHLLEGGEDVLDMLGRDSDPRVGDP